MKNSEKLALALKNNTKSVAKLFQEANIEIDEINKEYALFLIDNEFEIVPYITRDDSSFKGFFLSQNNTIFVGYIGEYNYLCLNFSDIVEQRISDLENLRD
jgi:hypothetical protein